MAPVASKRSPTSPEVGAGAATAASSVNTIDQLPSFTDLFGTIDKAEGLEARSVLSPAAYLVDLLQLKDRIAPDVSPGGYRARRPDVGEVPLDDAGTFAEVPSLEVSNEVMSALVERDAAGSADARLEGQIFPPPLPFSPDHERLKVSLEKLGSNLAELYRSYQPGANGHEVARLRLGLSQAEHSLFAVAHETGDLLAGLWGIRDDAERDALVAGDAGLIRRKLGLSPRELRAVVCQNLSEEEISSGAAATFFINQDPARPGTYLTLAGDQTADVLHVSDGAPLSFRHLDRLMRFVRLSRRLRMAPADLDWILQTACAGVLDADSLWSIAVAFDLAAAFGLPVDQLCCLWAEPKRHGKGDDPEPRDLFDQIFNRGYPTPIESLAQGGFTEALAGRLLAALRLSRADYQRLTEGLAARGTQPSATVPYFALLYRMASLARALSLSLQELIALLDVLDAQWATSAHPDLAPSIPLVGAAAGAPPARPALSALTGPAAPPRATLDVLQRLVRLKQWLDLRQMSVRQLAFICLEDPGGGAPVDGVAPADAIESALSELYQALLSTLLQPADVQTGSLTARGGRTVFDALCESRALQIPAGIDPASPRALVLRQPEATELVAALRRGIGEHLEVYPADLMAAGAAASFVQDLFDLLQERGYLEAAGDQYRIPPAATAFFLDPANLSHFYLPELADLQEAVFNALAAKSKGHATAVERLEAEAAELADRLVATVDGQSRTLRRILASQLSLPEDVAGMLFDFVFGTPDDAPAQTLAGVTVPLFDVKGRGGATAPALGSATLAVRFRRVQQFALLLGKAGFTAEEGSAFFENQHVHRELPETLKLPAAFVQAPATLDAVTTLDGGDVLAVSGTMQARLSGRDYRVLGIGTLDQIPGLPLPPSFTSGIDCAFRDADGRLYVFAGDQFVSGDAPLQAKRLADTWGKVRNLIQQDRRVDAAFQDERGRIFLFRGDQYVRYSDPARVVAGNAFVDEGYPRSIRLAFEQEQVSLLPSVMNARVDAAFRDSDGSYFFFSGDKFTHSADPYALRSIRGVWGVVRNRLFGDDRVDAAFVSGDRTYLLRADQLLRYTGGEYGFADEGFPVSFASIPGEDALLSVLRGFPDGIDAAMVGKDGALHVFAGGVHASSAAPDQRQPIRDLWGRVRNCFEDLKRVDAAFSSGGSVYLFCDDQYVRYSGPGYQYADEGYPRRVRGSWSTLEGIGSLPDGLPDPITAVATGKSGDVYFFAGNQFAGPDGNTGAIKDQWARVRNNVERLGRVDATLIDGAGKLYLFTGDQLTRYTSLAQPYADEGYPKPLASGWAQEGQGFALPGEFAAGISASLRAPDQRVFFFSGTRYARVDAQAAPRPVGQDWGLVRNWIAEQGRVNAAFSDAQGRTFLFGGDQFSRYSGPTYDSVDDGYPLAIADRWGNLPPAFRAGVDSALAYTPPGTQVPRLYLFKGTDYVRYSNGNYTQVDAGYPRPIASGEQVEGAWFRGFAVSLPDDHSSNQPAIALSAVYADTYLNQPRICLFYFGSGDNRQLKREYRIDNNGKLGWTPPMHVDGLTEYAPFTRISASFVARDGTLHLFSDQSYASRPPQGGPLSPPVPIKDRWARVWNQIALLGRVDATLDMGDGRTYLFAAQQYVRYTGALRPGDADFYVDEGYPRKIASGWNGENVPISLPAELQVEGYALCREGGGKIHLFKGASYTFSGNPGPETAVAARWGRVLNQFTALNRVDAAYRAENDKLYLFCDTQFTRYSGALQPGAADFYADPGYPRTIATAWQGEGVAGVVPDQLQALGSAVLRDAQQTFVFSGGSFTGSLSGAPRPVLDQWARVRNRIREDNRVDAAFVRGEGAAAVTLLCSGDQYVRYSGDTSGFADEGYPKRLSLLAATEGIPPLPASFLTGVCAAFLGRDGNLHAFSRPAAGQAQQYVCSAAPEALLAPRQKWGIVDNHIHDQAFVNAALLAGEALYLFGGDQFVRYSGADRRFVDEGYPKKVVPAWGAEIHASGLPAILARGVDAALGVGDTSYYFVEDQYVESSAPETARPLADRWGRVDNRIQATSRLDAAFVAPDGRLYLFSGDQYALYSGAARDFVDEGYPLKIGTHVGQAWPAAFQQGVDSACVVDGRSVLFKGQEHLRFSDVTLRQPDRGYPRLIEEKLAARPDFTLSAVPDYWPFKDLSSSFGSPPMTLLQYLGREEAGVSELAAMTGWPASEIDFLLGSVALPGTGHRDARTLAAIAGHFALAGRLGGAPSSLKVQLSDQVFGPGPHQLSAAADLVYNLVKAKTAPAEWPQVAKALRDPLNAARRDALVSYLLDGLGLRDVNDLYELLLNDVQMGAQGTTSRIVEAIGSIQLYYHRALMNLEEVPAQVQDELHRWWPWMKNYRVWEANRRVFLHPENYIRPELRKSKSQPFKELEQSLLQDQVTDEAAEKAYTAYLEKFGEVSRLRTGGGYVYRNANGERTILMLGFARTDPLTYYHRFGRVPDEPGNPIAWQPWEKVHITINAERVQPVFAFNRLFLFWFEQQPAQDKAPAPSTTPPTGDTTDAHQPAMKFSFLGLGGQWVQPQILRAQLTRTDGKQSWPAAEMSQAQLYVTNPSEASEYDPDAYNYVLLAIPNITDRLVGRLTAALDFEPRSAISASEATALTASVDMDATFPARLGLTPVASIRWGAHFTGIMTAPWFSFEASGGSFLCRPVEPPPISVDDIQPSIVLHGRTFPSINAAFGTPGGDLYVFDAEDGRARSRHYAPAAAGSGPGVWQPPVFIDDLTPGGEPAWPWSTQGNLFDLDPSRRIVNVVVAGGQTYFMTASEFFRYSPGEQRWFDPGYPAAGEPPLATLVEGAANAGGLPWMSPEGRTLINAFKYGEGLVVVYRTAQSALEYAQVTLDQLRTQVGYPPLLLPFGFWDRIDSVFTAPPGQDPQLNLTCGRVVATLKWGTPIWSLSELDAYAVNETALSVAFVGVDNKLYFICGDRYTEAVAGNQPMFHPVAERWGNSPPLSPDSTFTGPDGEVYLFSGRSCTRYSNVNPVPSGGWVPDAGFPKLTSALLGDVFDRVTAGFSLGARVYLFGERAGVQRYARYSKAPGGGLVIAPGYPKRVQGEWGNLPTSFNLGFDAGILVKEQGGAAFRLVLTRGSEMISLGGSTGHDLYELSEVKYSIVRLNTNTAERFSQILLGRGVDGLLSVDTQQIQEMPRFSTSPGDRGQNAVVCTDTTFLVDYPDRPTGSSNGPALDFESANGFYYWEIFFHIPYLIAQGLNQAQQFDPAKRWAEHVFNPTKKSTGPADRSYWTFLPFHDATGNDERYLEDRDQLELYRDDPFDPHALAQLRPVAYRKSFVMSYIDNLLDWGDLLFQQYTRESLGEATMLYVLAADLLGKKPEELGRRRLVAETVTYDQLVGEDAVPGHLLELENATGPNSAKALDQLESTPNDTIANPYFFLPENEQFIAYWDRVGDRLFKLRNGLNLEGVRQALDLFAPPVDVMALVTGAAAGRGSAQALADRAGVAPHYRFSFMLARARELAGRLVQLGGSLLTTLEKKDAEDLSLLRNTQERGILEAMLQIKVNQLEGARQSMLALREGLRGAQTRRDHYQRLLAEGLSPFELLHVLSMLGAQGFSMGAALTSLYAAMLNVLPSFSTNFKFGATGPLPTGLVGLGFSFGGPNLGAAMNAVSLMQKRAADSLNFMGSLASIIGGWDRRRQDWELQRGLASHDVAQIERQIDAAAVQVEVARQEIQVQRRQIQNNTAVDTFMRSKFTSSQLYQWMAGKLSAVYFQTYQLALDYAKAAQRALQFEMGWLEENVQYIGAYYWDNLKKGLLAGDQLQVDLDRLEKAHIEKNKRRFEITKTVSLLQLDPMALLQLKQKGRCELELGESSFDYDFPGHYCRQIKSVSVSFPAIVGPHDNFNATMTQLAHRTVLAPNIAAVKYLLTADGDQPDSIRSDWRPVQQVALSRGVNDSGLFQLNYQDERYLPFEGTGAVSRWRLEINGVDGPRHREHLSDVIITVQYTAIAGGDDFAEKVKSALPPAGQARMINLAYDFAQEWQAFLLDPARGISFTLGREQLPGAVRPAVTGLFMQYDLTESGTAAIGTQAMKLNGRVDLRPGSFSGDLDLPAGLWKLMPTGRVDQFSPENIRNVALIVTYLGKPTF